MHKIELSELTRGEVRNLSGQERGGAARTFFRLDHLDQSDDPIEVIVPDELDAITSSFFQGMFAASIRHFGDRVGFLGHYKFIARTEIMRQVHRGIDRVETDRTPVLH